jgi:hypothetical protein
MCNTCISILIETFVDEKENPASIIKNVGLRQNRLITLILHWVKKTPSIQSFLHILVTLNDMGITLFLIEICSIFSEFLQYTVTFYQFVNAIIEPKNPK